MCVATGTCRNKQRDNLEVISIEFIQLLKETPEHQIPLRLVM